MQLVDLIDAAAELAPQKWKRYAATAFIAAFLLVPNKAADALTWYATERADQIVKAVLDTDGLPPADSRSVRVRSHGRGRLGPRRRRNPRGGKTHWTDHTPAT